MSFRCPQCATRDGLEIEGSIELPPDRDAQELCLQVVVCKACTFRGLAVYSEGRGDCPESETWNHIGYWVSPDAVDSVAAAIRSCPNPHDSQCTCPAHVELGQKDLRGRWRGLLELEHGHTFAMRLFLG